MQRHPVSYVSVDLSRSVCSCVHRSLDSVDPRLGQQCVAGRPLCLFGTRLSSCSSIGACDFVVGSTACAISTGTSPSGPELSLGCWLLSTEAVDGCALATVGLGKFRTGLESALLPSPLPACSGAPELAGTTTTSLCSTACLVTVGASSAAASAGRPATGVPLMATIRFESSVLTSADIESCEPQRCPLSCQ